MQFTYGLPLMAHPQNPDYLTARAIATLAKAAEDAGFASVSLTEHPIPFDPWLATGGHDALDPFVGLAFAAAATDRIRLQTNLTPLPYRNPALLAKTVATLDRLSGGRVVLGVGTGYLAEEFAALGVEFEERNALFDESIDVMRMIWTGESVTYKGLHFDIDRCTAHPTPVQKEIPIWIGGNSALSRRRVAEKAQAWMPMPNPRAMAGRRRSAHLETRDDLKAMLEHMRSHAESVGRSAPIDVSFMLLSGGAAGTADFNPEQILNEAGELAELGITYLSGPVRGDSIAEISDNLAKFGAEVIARA
ncbi:MAG: LLM class F420-dependent oxidoreductase [Acidimicrobiia bacterium]